MSVLNASIDQTINADSNNLRQNCKHCGLPLESKNSDAKYDASDFCCHGCATVYHVIHANNLEFFYKLKAEERINPASDNVTNFSYYDDPIFQSKYVTQVSNTEANVSFYVERIHCSACVWLLEKLTEFIPGLVRLRANLGNSSIKVTFNPQATTLSNIAQQISSFGYKPVELTEDSLKQSRISYERDFLLRLGVAGFCAGNTMLLAVSLYQGEYTGIETKYRQLLQYVSAIFALPAVFYSAMPFYRTAWSSLRIKHLHIDTPISLGVLVGFIGGIYSLLTAGDALYFDSICILIFLLLAGRWLQYRMLARANSKLNLTTHLPKYATRITGEDVNEILLDRVNIGDRIRVAFNQVIPVDGCLLISSAEVDNAHITGESRPVSLTAGDYVYAGAINKSNVLELNVTAIGENSRIGKVLKHVAENVNSKPLYQDFTSKLSYWFTFVIVGLAFFTLYINWDLGFDQALTRVIALLVVTCPCALGLSAPLAATVAVSKSYKHGILIRSSQVFEKLAKIRQAFFDKTGTLTSGVGQVISVYDQSGHVCDEYKLIAILKIIYAMEKNIEHPVALALREYSRKMFTEEITSLKYNRVNSIPGCGVEAVLATGLKCKLGKVDWVLESYNLQPQLTKIIYELREQALTTVAFKIGEEFFIFAIGDQVLPNAKYVFTELKRKGISSAVISGDSTDVVRALAKKFIEELSFALGDLSPEDKARIVSKHEQEEPCMMVGDGINDVVAMSQATLSVAIRGGVEACLNTADVFIGSGKIESVVDLVEAASKTRHVIQRNIFISLFYNVIGGYGAITGLVNPLVAAILMPLSSVSIIYSSFKNAVFNKNS